MTFITVFLCCALGVGISQRISVGEKESVEIADNNTPLVSDPDNRQTTPSPEPTETPAEVTAEPTPEATPDSTPTPEPTVEPTPVPTAETAGYSEDPMFYDTDSLLVVANKVHPLPDGYEPADLVQPNVAASAYWLVREEAARALEEMFAAADNDGVHLVLGSAYRSASYQATLWNGYANQYGTERADRISSRPGYSDHQTGLAVDIVMGDGSYNGYNFNQAFEDTDQGNWLRVHAHEYGWIMRYPKGKEEITGYAYEPWHFRYIGVDYATAIYNVDEFESFEEYFNVEGGTEYR